MHLSDVDSEVSILLSLEKEQMSLNRRKRALQGSQGSNYEQIRIS